MKGGIGVHRTTANPTWRTPAAIFAALDDEFHFTLDPCASSPIKPGISWFSDYDNGLWREWTGRVFINPPYGRAIRDWMRKVALERHRCDLIVALVPCRTDTDWWHQYAMLADEIRFVRGRLSFEGVVAPKGHNAPFPSVILIFGHGIWDTPGPVSSSWPYAVASGFSA
jgi:site-specific DNA-methyltransferase (adenine-specific)